MVETKDTEGTGGTGGTDKKSPAYSQVAQTPRACSNNISDQQQLYRAEREHNRTSSASNFNENITPVIAPEDVEPALLPESIKSIWTIFIDTLFGPATFTFRKKYTFFQYKCSSLAISIFRHLFSGEHNLTCFSCKFVHIRGMRFYIFLLKYHRDKTKLFVIDFLDSSYDGQWKTGIEISFRLYNILCPVQAVH